MAPRAELFKKYDRTAGTVFFHPESYDARPMFLISGQRQVIKDGNWITISRRPEYRP